MKAIGSRPDVRLFTVRQGAGINLSGHFQHFGCDKGTSDILGILAPSGRFLAIEVKTGNAVSSTEQAMFQNRVRIFGGLAIVAYSVEDVLAALP